MKVGDLDSVCVVCVGTNGTGKTTKLRQILEATIKGGKKKVLVIPSNPAEHTFNDVPLISLADIDKFHHPGVITGARRVLVYNQDEFIQATRNMRNTVLLSDDFRNYLPTTRMHEEVRRLYIDRRHKRNDIWLACHGFTQIPPEIISWISHFIIFRCKDNPKRHRDKFLDAEKTRQTVIRVNEVAHKTNNPYYFEINANE